MQKLILGGIFLDNISMDNEKENSKINVGKAEEGLHDSIQMSR